MPEFILNVPPSAREISSARGYGYTVRRRKTHPYYDLSDFAKGYVEAMFFTNGDTGDEYGENYLNELGVARLTGTAVADIAKDCAAFWTANESDLESAKQLEPGKPGLEYGRNELNDARLGNLFWFARQGHGVAFTDDGYADCLDRLQEAARRHGEAYCETWRGWIYHR